MVVQFQDFMEDYNLLRHAFPTLIYNKEMMLPIVLLEPKALWHLSQRNYRCSMELR